MKRFRFVRLPPLYGVSGSIACHMTIIRASDLKGDGMAIIYKLR